MTNPELPFHNMAQRHIGLTEEIANYWTQGARVCLDRHHQPPVSVVIKRERQEMVADAIWEATDERTRRAWANELDTTEAGAYALILASAELFDGLVAVSRAETETGADYYVAPIDADPDDLEEHLRLEVSGVDRGNEAVVQRRLRDKLSQLSRGSSNLPGVAGVIGFQAKLILLAKLE